MPNKAIFFDRDGTLNVDVHYLHDPEQFVWVDGAIDAIRWANTYGYLVIVVTNQSGIARGYYDEAAVQRLHDWMNAELAMIHPPAKNDIDPLDRIYRPRILRHHAAQFLLRLHIDTFIRVDIKHPVRICLRQSKVALRRKIAVQRMLNDARSRRFGKRSRAICTAVVNNKNFIGKGSILNTRRNMLLLIVRENNDRELHTSAVLIHQRLSPAAARTQSQRFPPG